MLIVCNATLQITFDLFQISLYIDDVKHSFVFVKNFLFGVKEQQFKIETGLHRVSIWIHYTHTYQTFIYAFMFLKFKLIFRE